MSDIEAAARALVELSFQETGNYRKLNALISKRLIIGRVTSLVSTQVNEALERAAGVAETRFEEWGKMGERFYKEGDRENALIRIGWSNGASAIAAEIRALKKE